MVVAEGLALQRAPVQSSRHSVSVQQEAEQPKSPQAQVAPCPWVPLRVRARGRATPKMQDSMAQGLSGQQVAMPVPELTAYSCILCSTQVRQETVGKRRIRLF